VMINSMHPRIKRESNTARKMIELYCRKHHSSESLCPQCSAMFDYVQQKLEKCPFQEGKTTCAKCPVHCYKPDMREKIRVIMRYSGPRMLYRHPVATLWHLIDGRRQEPVYSRDEKWK